MDFTLKTYNKLLNTLSHQGFSFLTFAEFLLKASNKAIVLRHDVDALPGNSLKFARIQAELGIIGSYYFRIVQGSWDEAVIKEIAGLGHEIGYHYEDLGATAQRINGTRAQRHNGAMAQRINGTRAQRHNGAMAEEELVRIAIESFTENLENLRKIVPVKTICMHGSPLSKWDSRLLWKYYDYRDFGIIGEPYFDVDFDEVMYLTDTGRRWDGEAFNIRDKAVGGRRKAEGEKMMGRMGEWENGRRDEVETKGRRDEETLSSILTPEPSNRRTIIPFPKFHSTFDIIRAAENGKLPDKIMMTFHPQRWTDKPVPWVKELVWQNVKNVVKYFVVNRNSE